MYFEEVDNLGSVKIGNYNDNLFGGAIAIGYDFNPKFDISIRTSLSILYTSFKESESIPLGRQALNLTGKFDTQIFFLNVYYDFHNTAKFTPYIGADLGMSLINTKLDASANNINANIFPSKSKTNFAWNIGAGVSYAFTDSMSIDLAYRYAQLGKGETATLAQTFIRTDSINAHQIMMGFRYTF